VRPRGEKADEPGRLPFPRGNGRKLRGIWTHDWSQIDAKSLEITLFRVQGCTTENRGVPGSSPGLAIAEQSATAVHPVQSGA
jgi:hypothetical protein